MDEDVLYRSKRFCVHRVPVTLENGTTISKEVIRHPGSVVIVPFLPDGRICLIRNFRAAVGATLIELPAGTLEPDEDPQACAYRELIEETGYRAGAMRHVTSFYAAPGILDENMRLFFATSLTPGDPAREPGELIENWIVSPEEIRTLIADGTIRDAKTLVGLLLAQIQ